MADELQEFRFRDKDGVEHRVRGKSFNDALAGFNEIIGEQPQNDSLTDKVISHAKNLPKSIYQSVKGGMEAMDTGLNTLASGAPIAGNFVAKTPAMEQFAEEYPRSAGALKTAGSVLGYLPAAAATGGLSGLTAVGADAALTGGIEAVDKLIKGASWDDIQKAGIIGALLGGGGRALNNLWSLGWKPKVEQKIVPNTLHEPAPHPFNNPESVEIAKILDKPNVAAPRDLTLTPKETLNILAPKSTSGTRTRTDNAPGWADRALAKQEAQATGTTGTQQGHSGWSEATTGKPTTVDVTVPNKKAELVATALGGAAPYAAANWMGADANTAMFLALAGGYFGKHVPGAFQGYTPHIVKKFVENEKFAPHTPGGITARAMIDALGSNLNQSSWGD